MPTPILDEREFELINIIGPCVASQREISKRMDLSLGMTNMLIRRLVAKGYIRVRQLNKRKMEYLLTPKGFAEKMRKSIRYTIKTLQSIRAIKDKIKALVSSLHKQGERKFLLIGDSDLALLVKMVFEEPLFRDCEVCLSRTEETTSFDGILLVCTEKFSMHSTNAHRVVNLLEELARSYPLEVHPDAGSEGPDQDIPTETRTV